MAEGSEKRIAMKKLRVMLLTVLVICALTAALVVSVVASYRCCRADREGD